MPKHLFTIPRILFLLLILSTIINGSNFWLKRVGWYKSDELTTILVEQRYLFKELYRHNPAEHSGYSKINQIRIMLNKNHSKLIQSMNDASILFFASKTGKYLVYFFLIAFSLYATNFSLLTDKNYIPIILTISWTVIATLMNFELLNWQATFAGTYCLGLLLIAFSGQTLTKPQDFAFLTKLFGASLLVLLLLSIIEIKSGIRLFQRIPFFEKRTVGFMIQPSSMGAYVICAFTLYAAYHQKYLGILLFVSSLLIVMSSSNTAAIALFITTIWLLFIKKRFDFSLMFKSSLFVIVTTILFWVLNIRPSLFSLLGRVKKYEIYFSQDFSITNFIQGLGLGISSNTLILINYKFPIQNIDYPSMLNTDSTPLLLIIQIGFIGCILFYGMLIKAMIDDQQLRLVYFVFILCSLTINIIEVFPLNIVLGLMLAKSFNERSQLSLNSNSKKQDLA